MKKFVVWLLFCGSLLAKHSHEEKVGSFNPWYAGSLLSISAENMPVNVYNVQPYIFVTVNYGVYDDSFSFISIPNLVAINPFALWQTGILPFMDIQLIMQSFHKTREGQWSSGIGDSTVTIGFQLHKTHVGDPIPTLRFTVAEIFPTGKFDNLKREKLRTDLRGTGSFQTQIALVSQKTYYWLPENPMRIRLNLIYTYHAEVHLQGLNNLGGSENTDIHASPPQTLQFFFSPEFSFNQNWVLTWDMIYTHAFKGRIRGQRGTEPDGSPAPLTVRSRDNFNFVPAIEYNFNQDLGILLGGQIILFGRNSIASYSGIFSVTYVY